MGGGYGVKYTEDDVRFPIETGFDDILNHLKEVLKQSNRNMPHLMIEPGRSITAEAAITVYEAGTIKDIPGVSKYISIDGGMSDHNRTPLYGAHYEVIRVELKEDSSSLPSYVLGKLCESGA